MNLQRPILKSGLDGPLLENGDGEITERATPGNVGTSDATDTAVRVPLFDLDQQCRKDPLLKIYQINPPEIFLRDIGDAQVFSVSKSFGAYELDYAKAKLSITTIITANRPEACESASSSTSRVLNTASFAVVFDERN